MICVLGTVVLSLPAVQTGLAQYATNRINRDFGTNIQIDRLRISLISWNTALKDIYIEDYRQDTLAYIGELRTSILNLRDLTRGKLEFGDIKIDRLYLNMKTYRDAPDTNLGPSAMKTSKIHKYWISGIWRWMRVISQFWAPRCTPGSMISVYIPPEMFTYRS